MIRKKILLLGDFHVGKTSLIRRYVDNSFDDSYLTTIGVKISKKQIILNGEPYELLIWDIEGATPQKKIPKGYFKGASGAIFVADVSRDETIGNLKAHIDDFLSVNSDAAHVTAYNKADLLSPTQQKNFIQEEGVYLTSAKEDMNVERLFEALVQRMAE
jgi:small GTP-binding protein